MGREVRKVPANWEHPKSVKYGEERPQPMHDEQFDDVFANWLADFDRIRCDGLSEDERKYYPRGLADWLQDEGSPPDPAYYRPWKDEDAIWFQLWETVSEGTPVSPPFATKAELVDYLVANGDAWDQKRGHGGWKREAAERFVEVGWAPSMMVLTQPGKPLLIHEARDGPLP